MILRGPINQPIEIFALWGMGLSSPLYVIKGNCCQRYQANRIFTLRELFWCYPQLCAHAGGI